VRCGSHSTGGGGAEVLTGTGGAERKRPGGGLEQRRKESNLVEAPPSRSSTEESLV